MEQWYCSLMNYVKDHPPNYGDDGAQSILEMLYGYYNQCNRMDTAAIKAGIRLAEEMRQ